MTAISVAQQLVTNVANKLYTHSTAGQVAIITVEACNRGGAGLQTLTLYVSKTNAASAPTSDVVAVKVLKDSEEWDKSGIILFPGESLWAMASGVKVSVRAFGYIRPGNGSSATALLAVGQILKLFTATSDCAGSVMAVNQAALAARFSFAISDKANVADVPDYHWLCSNRQLFSYERYGQVLIAGQSIFVLTDNATVSVRAQFMGA